MIHLRFPPNEHQALPIRQTANRSTAAETLEGGSPGDQEATHALDAGVEGQKEPNKMNRMDWSRFESELVSERDKMRKCMIRIGMAVGVLPDMEDNSGPQSEAWIKYAEKVTRHIKRNLSVRS